MLKESLIQLLKENIDIFAWQPTYMDGGPRKVIEHKLKDKIGTKPVTQKKIGQSKNETGQ